MNYSASGTLRCSKQSRGSVPGVIGSSYYAACAQPASTTAENQLFTLNTINAATPALNPIVSIQGSLADAMTLLPIAASPTTLKPQFAFIQSTKGQGYGVMMDKPGSTIPAPLIGPISPNVTHPKLAFIENGQPFVEDEVDGDEGGSGGKAKAGLLFFGAPTTSTMTPPVSDSTPTAPLRKTRRQHL
ncbi:hypothetical protein BGX24_000331 [Mortierella sp. AD032]|nr:hypothetical protein BGX24_000331 [Mortierella sp. AD032]